MRAYVSHEHYSKILDEYNEFYYKTFLADKSEINYARKEMYENFLAMVTFKRY